MIKSLGERIIWYSNIIQIAEAEYKYSYLYSVDIFKPNNIRIRIWSIFSNQIIFVFIFDQFFLTEYYLCSYSVDFFKPNDIRMRDPMNDVMMNPMGDRGERIIRYSNIIQIVEAEF